MAQDNAGLLIAALVAIVAVVGLVILFKGGSSGAVTNVSPCPIGYQLPSIQNYEGQAYTGCVPTLSDVEIMPQQADMGGKNIIVGCIKKSDYQYTPNIPFPKITQRWRQPVWKRQIHQR